MNKHKRVIPRDFFNEAKLLKCLGRLSLLILENRVNELPLKEEFDGRAFSIIQNDADGSLSVENYKLLLDGEKIELYLTYNSKENYPLMGRYRDEEYYLLSDKSGDFMPNFGFFESKIGNKKGKK